MIIRKRIFLMAIFLVLSSLISACSEDKSGFYIGKSDSWEVNYGRDEKFALTYIGEGEMPEGEINFIIETGSRTTYRNDQLDENDILIINRPFSESSVNTDIKVTVNWETYTEEFILERQQ